MLQADAISVQKYNLLYVVFLNWKVWEIAREKDIKLLNIYNNKTYLYACLSHHIFTAVISWSVHLYSSDPSVAFSYKLRQRYTRNTDDNKAQLVTWRAPPCLGKGQLFMGDLWVITRRVGKSGRLPVRLDTEARQRRQIEYCVSNQSILCTTCAVPGFNTY